MQEAWRFMVNYGIWMVLTTVFHIFWILAIVCAFCFASWIKGNGWQM